MDVTKLLSHIKIALGLEEAPASPSYTLQDGTPITISELIAGGTAIVGDAPAPVGEHTLSDGTVIVIAEPGIIAEVKAPVEAAAEPAPAPADPAKPAEQAPTAMQLEEMVKSAVKEFVAEEMKKYATKMAKQDEALKGLVSITEQILATPAKDPVQTNKTAFKKEQPESKVEKYGRLAKVLETIKN